MIKQILIVLVLVVLTVCGEASDTNQTVVVPSNSQADFSNDALSFLASASSDFHTAPGDPPNVVVSTNKPVWESRLSVGLTLTAGNSDSTLVTGNFRTHKKTLSNEWTVGGDGAYGEVSSVKNNESLHGFAQYNHLFDERWYGYVRADALHDAIADVTYRFTFSPGVGYYFINNPETSLAGEFGPAILYEKLDGEYHTYPVLRLAERFEHKFDEHARLWQNLEFLPPADSPRNFLVNAEVGIETPITHQLSLQVYVQDNYANQPAPGREDNDVKLVSALAIKF